ncbi:MAG: leucine-rich repeat protein, partial [Kiritimatiellae bacterium]|nr:leucine-rich repeat protein [Kiritimatiellia bacterium]
IDGEAQNGVVANVITSVRVIRNGKDDVTANYTLAPYNGTLTVTKRPVTLTSKSASKVYDGDALTAHEVEVGGDGFVGEDGASYVFTGLQTEKGKSKNTFTYSLKGGTNAAFYEITKVEGDLEVTALDIAGGDDEDWEIVLGPALTYTGLEQIQTLASVCYKGLSVDYSVTGNAATDAGSYSMTLTGQGNFMGEKAVAWSIAPKALTLTAGSGTRVYDGTPFTVGAVTAVGFVAGEGAEYECDGAQKDVGSSVNDVSAIRWNANTKGGNYTVTKVPGTLTVTPRPLTLTAANISKPYDGTPLTLTAADVTADGLVAGESFIYSNFASRTEAGQTPATFDYAPGAGTSLANYTVTVTPGRMITITKSVTAISVTAASDTWVYDGEDHSNRTWTATNLDTLQAGDALEVTFDEASVVKTPQDGLAQDGVVANVITSVRVIRNGTDDVTANYTVEWFPGTLTVTKRPVTVAVVGKSAAYTYDSEEKTVSGYDISTEDELYDIAADTVFSGTESASRTDAGKSDMGLSAGNFANNNDCFEVTYQVTDGYVKIDPLDISEAAADEFEITLGANPKYNGTVQTIPVTSVTCGGLPVTYTLAGENATHAGTYTLTVKANGNFTGERSTTWQVLKRRVTLTSASAAKVYDGSPLINQNVTVGGDGFIGIEGAIFDVTGSQTVAGSSKNTFTYSLKAGTLSADYDITKVEGALTVTKANVGSGTDGGEEPGNGEMPQDGVSKFDASFVYDGKGHTIDTNALKAAFSAAMIGGSAIEYAVGDGSGGDGHAGRVTLPWSEAAPVYTNAGEYVVWYRVTNPNYNEFVHAAKVTITPRTGVVVDIVGNVATNVYNGAAQSIDGYIVAINDSLYKETDFEFVGNSAVSGTAPGKYPMGLLASQFSNKSKNFTEVTFNVTDGELVILELPQKNVILDAIGGAFAIGSVITQECEDVYLAFPVATREGYVFDGWYLGVTNGAPKVTAGAQLLIDDDHTLFAKWRIDEALMPGGASIFAWEAIDANTARITGFKNAAQKVSTLLLPDMMEGRFVTEIAAGAFANSKSGMTKLVLPMFCTKIGDKAFTGVASLSEIVFADVRRWDAPSGIGSLAIGRYAFSGAGVGAVTLPKSVGSIGDYAFANCRKLTNLTILGAPTVGMMPLRRAGLDVGGVTVHLDPALANDGAYMETLKQECGNVTVRADAVVTRMTLSSLAISAKEIVLSVSVEKAAQWGKVDLSLVKVACRESLSEKPTILNPLSVTENPDGSLTVRVVAPKGDSGFFQVVLEK